MGIPSESLVMEKSVYTASNLITTSPECTSMTALLKWLSIFFGTDEAENTEWTLTVTEGVITYKYSFPNLRGICEYLEKFR